ncbi:hypothetical protein V5799_019461 [Amblyomma americanum]|uniref:Regulatory protein zeste n=1 Tax=Amblyomma americanum TaxID=6943 RepID=A0AAQ4EWQ1_AMBAM
MSEKTSARVSKEYLIMVEFMEEHPALAHAASPLSGGYTAACRRELWQQLAALLNAAGPVAKSVLRWRHTWQVWCTRCKKQEAQFLAAGRDTKGGRLPGLAGRLCKLRSPGLVQGVAAPMYSSSSQNQPRVSVWEMPGTSGLQQAEARSPSDATPSEEELEEEGAPCDTASTQEQPGVVTGRPCHQQQSTRVEEVHQLLAETRRTNDLLEARSAEDVTFHARLLEEQRQTSTAVRSLTAAVTQLTAAVRPTWCALLMRQGPTQCASPSK